MTSNKLTPEEVFLYLGAIVDSETAITVLSDVAGMRVDSDEINTLAHVEIIHMGFITPMTFHHGWDIFCRVIETDPAMKLCVSVVSASRIADALSEAIEYCGQLSNPCSLLESIQVAAEQLLLTTYPETILIIERHLQKTAGRIRDVSNRIRISRPPTFQTQLVSNRLRTDPLPVSRTEPSWDFPG